MNFLLKGSKYKLKRTLFGGAGGARAYDFLRRIKIKEKNVFFSRGGGGGTRVSVFIFFTRKLNLNIYIYVLGVKL